MVTIDKIKITVNGWRSIGILFIAAWFLVSVIKGKETHAEMSLKFAFSQLPVENTDVSHRPQSSGRVVHFQSDYFPTPIVVPGDPLNRAITSFKLQGEFVDEGKGKGSITFDDSVISFNEYGDATKVRAKVMESSPITFYLVKGIDPEEKRHLYELVFADGTFPHRMYLVLSMGVLHPHRLLIRYGDNLKPIREDDMYRKQRRYGRFPDAMTPAHILNLRGPTTSGETLADVPLGPTIMFETLYYSHKFLRRLAISGILNGPGHLSLDPNVIYFNRFGDIAGKTLMGFNPIEVTLKQVDTLDPAKKGRRLFEVIPKDKELKLKYFLVLSPTEAGNHRMIIWEGDQIRQILPLRDPFRQRHLAMQAKLAEASAQEQWAIREMRRILGYRFCFKIEAGKIVDLSIPGGDDADRIGSTLEHLKNLKRLHLTNLRFTARELESLGKLEKLEELDFYICKGLTDGGLVHLQKLKNLRVLRFHCEKYLASGAEGEGLTDADLVYLKTLANLEDLSIIGQRITDIGLEHLNVLSNLKELSLSTNEITDAGLEHLKSLSNLRMLDLIQTRVTPTGKAELKSALPMLEIVEP